MTLPSLDDIDCELATRSHKEFTRLAWPIIEPGTPFIDGWHLDSISEHIEAATRREIRKLIINIPPRCMKSISGPVMWPAWAWLLQPHLRFVFASYGQPLATRDSLKCRRIIQSSGAPDARSRENLLVLEQRTGNPSMMQRIGYQGLVNRIGQGWKLAPDALVQMAPEKWDLAGDQNAKIRFENTATGFRIATSVGGMGTGEGGDFIVADDPHKVGEAESDLKREEVITWWDETMSTRMNDPKTGVRVVIMQRVHERDLCGHLLNKRADDLTAELRNLGWHHLCLPMEFEPSHPFVCPMDFVLESGTVVQGDIRQEAGELLWPERVGPQEVETLTNDMGPTATAGQLQQLPAPREGGIIKKRWWKYYDPDLVDDPRQIAPFTRLFQSWDTAFKDKTTSDYVVGQLWGVHTNRRFLLRQVRGQWSLSETKQQLRDLTRWADDRLPHLGKHSKYVENTANGPDVIAELKDEIAGIVPVDVTKDKVLRAEAIEPQLSSGRVFVPGYAASNGMEPDRQRTTAWVMGLIEECAVFPNGANDDQVDALTQALAPGRVGDGPAAGSVIRPAAPAGSTPGRDPYAHGGSSFG